MTAFRLFVAVLAGLLLAHEGWGQGSSEKGSASPYQEPTAPESRELLRAKLRKPVSADFVETPFKDVVSFIADSIGVQIDLDVKSLEEAAIPIDTPVALRLKNVTAATLLRDLTTRKIGSLDFVMRDGYIEISTQEKLDKQMEPRVYLVRDLPQTADDAPNASAAIHLIETSVEPTTWETRGSEGTIVPYGPILVIRQSPRVHDRIDDLIHEAREAIAQVTKP